MKQNKNTVMGHIDFKFVMRYFVEICIRILINRRGGRGQALRKFLGLTTKQDIFKLMSNPSSFSGQTTAVLYAKVVATGGHFKYRIENRCIIMFKVALLRNVTAVCSNFKLQPEEISLQF